MSPSLLTITVPFGIINTLYNMIKNLICLPHFVPFRFYIFLSYWKHIQAVQHFGFSTEKSRVPSFERCTNCLVMVSFWVSESQLQPFPLIGSSEVFLFGFDRYFLITR